MNAVEHYQRKNVAILKGTLRTAEEANQMAIDTNVELHGQGQKIDGLDRKLGKVNNSLDQCEETAKEINSYWYYLKNKIKRGLGIKKEPNFKDEDQPRKEEFGSRARSQMATPGLETYSYQKTPANLEEEEDELTDDLIKKLREMKGHSRAMGDELDRQKHVLDKMDNKMDRANLKTTKVNGILTKIMKK